jgi:hypothetical protein
MGLFNTKTENAVYFDEISASPGATVRIPQSLAIPPE